MSSSLNESYTNRADTSRRTPSQIISADKVNGTDVYNMADEKLGTIDSILIDKYSGNVAFVIMSFGGFLGIGEKFHPLPWEVLDYDTRVDGYRVDLNREELTSAPAYDRESITSYDYDRDTGGINDYYAGKFRRPAPRTLGDGYSDDGRAHGFYSPEQQAARNGPMTRRSDEVAESGSYDAADVGYQRTDR